MAQSSQEPEQAAGRTGELKKNMSRALDAELGKEAAATKEPEIEEPREVIEEPKQKPLSALEMLQKMSGQKSEDE